MPRSGQVPVPPERFREKLCPRCGQTKALSEFHKGNRAGLNPLLAQSSYCKECSKTWALEYKTRAATRALRRGYRTKRNLAKYGLTPESYEAMLLSQGKRCAICGTDKPGVGLRFAVDHCHKTGKNRGLLCTKCNAGIAMFEDDVAVMAAAITYIEDAKEK